MAHIHSVHDSDTHFSIDPITRKLKNESSAKTNLIQYDKNSERFTFDLPREIEGHDMAECNLVQVHYINIDSKTKAQNEDVYTVDDFQISPADEDVVICSWLISGNATQLVGPLVFLIRFSCIDETGAVVYAWHTATCTAFSISEGMNNGEAIVQEYPDVLAQFEARIAALEKGGGGGSVSDEQLTAAIKKYLDENPVTADPSATRPKIAQVTLLASGWVGDASPYSQVVEVEGATENSQVDLTPSIEQLSVFYQKDIAFVTENDGGVVTVYALGDKPANDYEIQVTIAEVAV